MDALCDVVRQPRLGRQGNVFPTSCRSASRARMLAREHASSRPAKPEPAPPARRAIFQTTRPSPCPSSQNLLPSAFWRSTWPVSRIRSMRQRTPAHMPLRYAPPLALSATAGLRCRQNNLLRTIAIGQPASDSTSQIRPRHKPSNTESSNIPDYRKIKPVHLALTITGWYPCFSS